MDVHMRYTVILCKAIDGRLNVKHDHVFASPNRKGAFAEAVEKYGSVCNPKDGWYVVAISPGQHQIFYFDEGEGDD